MTIEDLSDWNTILSQGAPWLGGDCGCCEMPTCPLPVQECQSADIKLCGFTPEDIGILQHPDVDERLVLYATCTYSGSSSDTAPPRADSESHSITFTKDPITVLASESCGLGRINATYTATISNYHPPPDDAQLQAEETRLGTINAIDSGSGVVMVVNYTSTEWDTSGTIVSGPTSDSFNITLDFLDFATVGSGAAWAGSTLTYTGFDSRFSVADSLQTIALSDAYTASTAAAALAAVTIAPEDYTGTGCQAQSAVTLAPDDIRIHAAAATAVRYRWVIPDTFEGSYFKITWDILEEPDGWDDETPSVTRSFVSEDNTWEWTGPGDPEDPDSWKSGWYEIDPPTVAGVRRVVNIRYECYRSPYGNKPEITGEGVTLPDP